LGKARNDAVNTRNDCTAKCFTIIRRRKAFSADEVLGIVTEILFERYERKDCSESPARRETPKNKEMFKIIAPHLLE